jgi:hypothetical protein
LAEAELEKAILTDLVPPRGISDGTTGNFLGLPEKGQKACAAVDLSGFSR